MELNEGQITDTKVTVSPLVSTSASRSEVTIMVESTCTGKYQTFWVEDR